MRWRQRNEPNLDVGGEGEEHRHEHIAAPPEDAEPRPWAFRFATSRHHFSRSKGLTNPPGHAGRDGIVSEAPFGKPGFLYTPLSLVWQEQVGNHFVKVFIPAKI